MTLNFFIFFYKIPIFLYFSYVLIEKCNIKQMFDVTLIRNWMRNSTVYELNQTKIMQISTPFIAL